MLGKDQNILAFCKANAFVQVIAPSKATTMSNSHQVVTVLSNTTQVSSNYVDGYKRFPGYKLV